MSNQLAVLFPGIGYHTDKPLLYYSAKLARARACRVSAGAFLMLCRKSDFVVYCSHLKKSTARRKTVWRILYRIIYLAGRR